MSEVFADEEIAGLKECLRSHYSYIYTEGEKKGSGLLILSKRPVADLKFIPFGCQSSECMLGFFEGKIQGKDGKNIRICLAQLQPYREYLKERLQQEEQIEEHIKNQKEELPTFFVETLNLIETMWNLWNGFQGKIL